MVSDNYRHGESVSPLVLVPLILLAILGWWIFTRIDKAPKSAPVVPKPEITAENALIEVPTPTLSDDIAESKAAESLIAALESSATYYRRLVSVDADTLFSFGKTQVSAKQMLESVEDLVHAVTRYGVGAELFSYIANNFQFFRANTEQVLFTGYFQAQLSGARESSEKYPYPLYATPKNLQIIELSKFPITLPEGVKLPPILRARTDERGKIVPFFSRDEIDYSAAIKSSAEVLAWVDDPIDAFFLQIQGSGVVTFEDGSTLNLGYDQSNGHPYRSIGRVLIERGFLTRENTTMQSIKEVLRQNPEIVRDVFNFNPSYVFFRKTEPGAFGNINVKLTPYRSIATDVALFPKGAPALINTEKPVLGSDGTIAGWERITRLVVNQDTGGAIKGPARVDLFTGYGPEAELVAGHMKQSGELWFFVKRELLANSLAK